MILYYVRHGQSANNALFTATQTDRNRVKDPELTELGGRQAERVAKALCEGHPYVRIHAPLNGGFGVTHLYSSLMVRAVNTARPIALALGLPLLGWKDIHEGGGIFLEDPVSGETVGYPGSSRMELTDRCPELIWPEDANPQGWWNRPFEDPGERLGRARRVLAELLRRHGETEDRVVFVSHGGFFYWFMHAALGLEPRRDLDFHIYNTSISCLEFNTPRGVEIRYLNRVDHLPAELIS
jgi:2,3-bisphosphoglycerate-dependent phosphoglycerate mutase